MGIADARLLRASSNILLRRLSPADQLLLLPFAEQVTLDRGAVMSLPGDRLDAVYFPETVMFSLQEKIDDKSRIEVAVIGCEGMLGWPALLGAERTTHAAVVQLRSGSSLRFAIEPLRQACERSTSLGAALRQFVHIVIVQMARSIASHLQDTLGLRLARWLLMRHDRLNGDILFVRHDEIAGNLNVRRASITDGLHVLEGERMIRCNRGKILVRDRPALESFAGDAYGQSEAHYRELIAPFGKTPVPLVLG